MLLNLLMNETETILFLTFVMHVLTKL